MPGFRSSEFQWLSSIPLVAVTLVLVVMAINTLAGAQTPGNRSREALFDFYQRLKPAPARAQSPIHLITIDEESLSEIGPWPWPRTLLADLVDRAVGAGARGVLIAEPLDTPDPLSPESIGDFWLKGTQDQALAEQLQQLPRTDEVLAQALSQTAAGAGIASDTNTALRQLQFARTDLRQSDSIIPANTGSSLLALPQTRERFPLNPALQASARRVVLNLPTDPDGVLRRSHVLWSLDARPVPTISLEAARLATEAQQIIAKGTASSTTSVGHPARALQLGERSPLALSGQGTLRHYFPRRVPVTQTSAVALLQNRVPAQTLNGRVILIGRDESTASTTVRSTLGTFAPMRLHAYVADQLASGVFLKRPVWVGYVEAIAVMLLGAGAIIISQRLEFWQALGFAALGAMIVFVLSASLFFFQGLLVTPIAPAIAMFVGALSIAGGKSVSTALFDDNVRATFKGLLPDNAMRAIQRDRTNTILQGDKRRISILSCELRLTDDDLESLDSSPEQVSEIMAKATHDLSGAIVAAGGTVDQAEGGRLFAYFNAPLSVENHVEKACAGALAMIEYLDKINAGLAASKTTRHIQIHLAIGITSGPCFVGPMGHGRTNRYSAIGRPIDLASLLRRQSEYYGPAIICDDQIYKDAHHKFAFLEVDRLQITSEDRPMNIHALIGNPFIKSSKSYRSLDADHRAMIHAYRNGQVEDAHTHLIAARKNPATKIALFDIYEARINTLRETGVPSDWDGVHQPPL